MLLLGACAVGGPGAGDGPGSAFPDDKAEPARPLASEPAPVVATAPGSSSGGAPASTAVPASTSTTGRAGAGAGAGAGSAPPAPFRVVTEAADRTGDAGLQARPYGDLTVLRLEDDGTRARVTVQVAGALPSPPADGEVMGIGVDVYRGDDEYQLFALGNADGWRAAFQANTEWAPYPGTFELGGNTLVFTVPWSALGGRRAGTMSVFADWSKANVAVVADASHDYTPDRGTQAFSP